MQHRSLLAPTLLALALVAASPAYARIVIVGIDGGSWSLIDPMLARGELAGLRALVERGVTGNLATVEPVSSPTVWTSIATGRTPAAHGITDFYSTRLDVRVPSVFERLAARGLRVGLYDYLVTWPPQRFPGGFSIPGWLRRSDAIAPPDAFARAGVTPYFYSMDDVRSPDEFVANCRRELAEKPGRFVRLLRAFALDVGAVTFYAVDAASHRFWDDAFPDEFDDGAARPDPHYASVIPDAVRGADRAVAAIAGALGPDDTLVVVSDHGFQAQSRGSRRVWETHLREWIASAGLDPARDGFEVAGGFAFATLRVLPGPFEAREATLDRLVALLGSARTPAERPLYTVDVLDVAERPPGAGRSLGSQLRQLVVRAYLWWLDVVLDQPAHAWVFGTPDAEAFDSIWPDGEVVLARGRVPVRGLAHPHDFSGRHHPTGIFLAAGHGIRHLPGRVEISVLDVAPLVLYLAGQPLPDDLEGALPEAIVEPALLAAQAPRTVAAAELPGLPSDADEAQRAASDAAISERLRSLGYVK